MISGTGIMPSITSATLTAFYLFDIAEQTDLESLRRSIGGGASSARLTTKTASPSYLQYSVPPVVAEGESIDLREVDGFRPRIKFFDYGVLSVALTRSFAGEWPELIALGQQYLENEELERRAEQIARNVAERFATCLTAARANYLTEDYLVIAISGLAERVTADDLIATRGEEITLLVHGERHPLSHQERDETMRNRLSYLIDDLVVPTWNAAFVYDTETGAQAALEIFEFANSQLLEFRYYDQLLDSELGRIYKQLQRPRPFEWLLGRGYVAATTHLHALFIDVNEITDRTENALKMVGDIYAARLFNLVAARLGLARWKASVEDKLETLDDIYRFAVEQLAIARGHFLELTVIFILVLELILFFLGIMK
jgi:hypothetical protein